MSIKNYKSWLNFKNLLIVIFLGFFMESVTFAQEQNQLFSLSNNPQENTQHDVLDEFLDNELTQITPDAIPNNGFNIQYQNDIVISIHSLPSYFKKPNFYYSFLSQAP
jgi:hypothetical protein